MVRLVATAELGLGGALKFGGRMIQSTQLLDQRPLFFGVLLVAPYLLVVIVYLSQVVVSIFRIMVLAALSPFLMLGFGFGWGRPMMVAGVRTLLSSFLVLFAATAALAVLLYAVKALGIGVEGNVDPEGIREMATFTNDRLLVAIFMGFAGAAFMAEATHIANSITGSALSNAAPAVITGGLMAGALAAGGAARHAAGGGLSRGWLSAVVGGPAAWAAHKTMEAEWIQSKKEEILERIRLTPLGQWKGGGADAPAR